MPKQIITPGQALLLLIDHYQHDPNKLLILKKLYLSGVQSDQDTITLNNFFSEPLLEAYDITRNMHDINNDSSRRYFETHLAYETLRNQLANLSITDLKSHNGLLGTQLYSLPPDDLVDAVDTLNGIGEDDEYAYSISRVQKGEVFTDFLPEEQKKIGLLLKISFLGINHAYYNNPPINIYGKGIFSEDERGKKLTPQQGSTRNASFGLLKGEMPIAQDDLAFSGTTPSYLKPSDQSHFVEQSTWVQSNFKKLTHPFSNSISGTVLGQLRTLADFQDRYGSVFTQSTKKMCDFLKLMICTRLYMSGGHTLNEYVSPIQLPEVQAAFFLQDLDKVNLESLFYEGNEVAFNEAMRKTIAYNKKIMQRENVRSELLERPPSAAIQAKIDALETEQQSKSKVSLQLEQQSIQIDNLLEETKTTLQLYAKEELAFKNNREGLITTLLTQQQTYRKTPLSFFDHSNKTNEQMFNGLSLIIDHTTNGDFKAARIELVALKNCISQTRKRTFLGRTTELNKFIESTETALNELMHSQVKISQFKKTIALQEINVKQLTSASTFTNNYRETLQKMQEEENSSLSNKEPHQIKQ